MKRIQEELNIGKEQIYKRKIEQNEESRGISKEKN